MLGSSQNRLEVAAVSIQPSHTSSITDPSLSEPRLLAVTKGPTHLHVAYALFLAIKRLSEEDDEPSNTNFHGIVAVGVSQPDRAGQSGRTCEPNTDLGLS